MRPANILAIAAATVMAFATVPAVAQNTLADPLYGTLHLSAGFTPDPQVISLRSGGFTAASNINPACTGFIATAPDVRLVYSAGDILPLIISVSSSSDTTLVINGPDGLWYCDDDSGVYNLNPSLRWNSPRSGVYDIWVGSYRSGTNAEAELHISEVRSQ